MQLREYQKNIIERITEAWNSGIKNVLIQLPTGSGKTIIFSHIISKHPGASIAIAHRVELISQMSLTLASNNIEHNIISNQNSIREIVSLHQKNFKRSYYRKNAAATIASVDTLIRYDNPDSLKNITLVVVDEAHHVLKDNKWGKALKLFPNARGLFPTATPVRSDGKGLGRHADGVIDTMIQGPSMRDLITENYLCDYRIFAPPNDLDLSKINTAAGGDYSPPQLRDAVRKSCITGDVVSHYLKIAEGLQGITFAVDLESAREITQSFRSAGVSAELISSKTPAISRAHVMQRFKAGYVLQLVNVDILGEGVDVPAVSVVSFARPTQSYGLYNQQFGRALRPSPGKTHAIIIDHVNNTLRHGLPDKPRMWTLDRREKKAISGQPMILTTCLKCFRVYSRVTKDCPYCGHYSPPKSRASIEFVDGDLFELDLDILKQLRNEIARIDGPPQYPQSTLAHVAPRAAIQYRHEQRQRSQKTLRIEIAKWAGVLKHEGLNDSSIYRTFYLTFGIDILSAQSLNCKDAKNLRERILMIPSK